MARQEWFEMNGELDGLERLSFDNVPESFLKDDLVNESCRYNRRESELIGNGEREMNMPIETYSSDNSQETPSDLTEKMDLFTSKYEWNSSVRNVGTKTFEESVII